MADERVPDVRTEPFAGERPGAFTWTHAEERPAVRGIRMGRPTAPPVTPAVGA